MPWWSRRGSSWVARRRRARTGQPTGWQHDGVVRTPARAPRGTRAAADVADVADCHGWPSLDRETRLSRLLSRKPTCSPSGEKKGDSPRSVPRSGVASSLPPSHELKCYDGQARRSPRCSLRPRAGVPSVAKRPRGFGAQLRLRTRSEIRQPSDRRCIPFGGQGAHVRAPRPRWGAIGAPRAAAWGSGRSPV